MKKQLIELSRDNIEIISSLEPKSPYKEDEELICDLFSSMPYNTDRSEITAKLLLLDYTYSTQLHVHRRNAHIKKIAENILNAGNFDELVGRGDPAAIEVILHDLDVNLFSFATKYCFLHNYHVYNRDDYSIYDSVVHRLLPRYSYMHYKIYSHPCTTIKLEQWRQNRDYKSFNDFIGKFLDDVGINTPDRRRKFDRFLWEQRENKENGDD